MGQAGGKARGRRGVGGAGSTDLVSDLEPPEIQPQLLALIMHFEDARGRSRASLLLSTRRACGHQLWLCRTGVRACPLSSTVFLAFRVTLLYYSAKSVCCSISPAHHPLSAQAQSSQMPVLGVHYEHSSTSKFFPKPCLK